MSRSSSRAALLQLLEPVVAGLGLDLEDLQVTPTGRRRLLRVVVDRDGGIELDHVAVVSRALSGALDDSDAMDGAPYVLEVTSPGVGRPLTEPRHWRRARTRLVVATLTDGSSLAGRVLWVGDCGVTLDVSGAPRDLSWAELGPGRVQVEINRPDSTPSTPSTPSDWGEGQRWTST